MHRQTVDRLRRLREVQEQREKGEGDALRLARSQSRWLAPDQRAEQIGHWFPSRYGAVPVYEALPY